MGFKEVFTFLQDIFPQVDLRILKAVAIEHTNDVDAAVEFILLDVLPSISRFCEASHTPQDTDETEYYSDVAEKGKQPILFGYQEVEEGSTSHLSGPDTIACEIAVSNSCTNSTNLMSACIGEAGLGDLNVDITDYSKELECLASHYNAPREEPNTTPYSEPYFMEKVIDVTSDVEDTVLHPKSHMHEKFVDVPLCNMNGKVNGCLESFSSAQDECPSEQQLSIGKSDAIINKMNDGGKRLYELDSSVAGSVVNTFVQNDPLEPFERISDTMENRKMMNVVSYSIHGSEEQPGCSLQLASHQELFELEANDTVSADVASSEDTLSSVSEVDGVKVNKLVAEPESVNDLLSFESGMHSANDNNLTASLATRSGHFDSIECLEDLISDAKRSKKKLESCIELATNMMREVELLEERTKQAKEAASSAGQDNLFNVEELKNMLKHAQEANDMHAGEVYGEKAILATEAQELQSRLLSLSDERNNFLAIIEEIRQTLQERLAAMEEEVAAAEQDKLEKEALAHKALGEQEVIVASVVEESKNLQKQAEMNSKLREFLMDRGRIVDELQGEMAIIREDVMLLKERVDGRVPLSGSLPFAPSSFAASSSSSDHRTKHSSDGVLEQEGFTENPPITEQEHCEVQRSERSCLNSNNGRESNYDGWELLKME